VNISQPKLRSEKFDDDDDNNNNNNNNNSCVKDVKYCSYRQHNEMPPPQNPKVTNPFHLTFLCFHHGRWSVGGLLLGLHAMW